ncbi:uncharacterized [Tachysurus ichikawai]
MVCHGEKFLRKVQNETRDEKEFSVGVRLHLNEDGCHEEMPETAADRTAYKAVSGLVRPGPAQGTPGFQHSNVSRAPSQSKVT